MRVSIGKCELPPGAQGSRGLAGGQHYAFLPLRFFDKTFWTTLWLGSFKIRLVKETSSNLSKSVNGHFGSPWSVSFR